MCYAFEFDLERESNQTLRKNIPITKKEKIYTIGNYPQWSLAQARTEHDILKGSVSKGVCVQTEKVESRKERPIVKDSFKVIVLRPPPVFCPSVVP